LLESLSPDQQQQVLACARYLASDAGHDPLPAHVVPGPPLTQQDYRQLIEDGFADVASGNVSDWEESKKEMRSW